MIDSDAKVRAEAWGVMAREANDARESNPYLEHLDLSSYALIAQALADAWWLGWDRAEEALKAAAR